MVKLASVPNKIVLPPALRAEQGEAILALSSQGISIRQIAESLGVKKYQVEKALANRV